MIKMVFLDLDKYNKERERLIREENMDYVDACNKAWREVMGDKRGNEK